MVASQLRPCPPSPAKCAIEHELRRHQLVGGVHLAGGPALEMEGGEVVGWVGGLGAKSRRPPQADTLGLCRRRCCPPPPPTHPPTHTQPIPTTTSTPAPQTAAPPFPHPPHPHPHLQLHHPLSADVAKAAQHRRALAALLPEAGQLALAHAPPQRLRLCARCGEISGFCLFFFGGGGGGGKLRCQAWPGDTGWIRHVAAPPPHHHPPTHHHHHPTPTHPRPTHTPPHPTPHTHPLGSSGGAEPGGAPGPRPRPTRHQLRLAPQVRQLRGSTRPGCRCACVCVCVCGWGGGGGGRSPAGASAGAAADSCRRRRAHRQTALAAPPASGNKKPYVPRVPSFHLSFY